MTFVLNSLLDSFCVQENLVTMQIWDALDQYRPFQILNLENTLIAHFPLKYSTRYAGDELQTSINISRLSITQNRFLLTSWELLYEYKIEHEVMLSD